MVGNNEGGRVRIDGCGKNLEDANIGVVAFAVAVSEEDVAAITHVNAMREFQFDPFAVRDRADCTVAALRAEAGHVDTEPVASGRVIEPPDSPVTLLDLMEKAEKIIAAAGPGAS